jgi:multidrug efflux pump subunit AcrA (membrane-fusion protein)
MKLLLYLIGITSVSVGFTACSSASSDNKPAATKEPDIQRVEVTTVQALQPSNRVTLPGELKPWNRVNMYAKVKGFVREIAVDRGITVHKG